MKSKIMHIILVVLLIMLFILQFICLHSSIDQSFILLETATYGIYFVIGIGEIIALSTGEEFPTEGTVLIWLFGACLFNILGYDDVMSTFHYVVEEKRTADNNQLIIFLKGACALIACVFMYIMSFIEWTATVTRINLAQLVYDCKYLYNFNIYVFFF